MRVFALGLVLLVGCSFDPPKGAERVPSPSAGAGGATAAGATSAVGDAGEAGLQGDAGAGGDEDPGVMGGSGGRAASQGGRSGVGGSPSLGDAGASGTLDGTGGLMSIGGSTGSVGGAGGAHQTSAGAGGHAGMGGFVEPASCSQIFQNKTYTCNALYEGNKICLDGSCVECGVGMLDCNGDPSDGCEAYAGDPAHCGGCGKTDVCKTEAGVKCTAVSAKSFVCQ